MNFASEPVPFDVEPSVASYLERQFNAIGLCFTPDGRMVLPTLSILPERSVPGGLIYVVGEGVYACISTKAEGIAEWIRIAPIETPETDPIEPPEANLSGKTWNDFL